jgi:hypothetical protein
MRRPSGGILQKRHVRAKLSATVALLQQASQIAMGARIFVFAAMAPRAQVR